MEIVLFANRLFAYSKFLNCKSLTCAQPLTVSLSILKHAEATWKDRSYSCCINIQRWVYNVSTKNRTATTKMASLHQFTTLLAFFCSILKWYGKIFKWLRTSSSCVVFITTIATWLTGTANFCADFEQHIIEKAINEWQNNCGSVSMLQDYTLNKCCNFLSLHRPTVAIEILFVWNI